MIVSQIGIPALSSPSQIQRRIDLPHAVDAAVDIGETHCKRIQLSLIPPEYSEAVLVIGNIRPGVDDQRSLFSRLHRVGGKTDFDRSIIQQVLCRQFLVRAFEFNACDLCFFVFIGICGVGLGLIKIAKIAQRIVPEVNRIDHAVRIVLKIYADRFGQPVIFRIQFKVKVIEIRDNRGRRIDLFVRSVHFNLLFPHGIIAGSAAGKEQDGG